MKEQLKELGYWLEGKIKDLCGELTPDKRIVTILVMLLILTIGNLYFTFSTIYNWGKESERKKHPGIEHIERLDIPGNRKEGFIDSEIDKSVFDSIKATKPARDDYSGNVKPTNFKDYELRYTTEAKA